MREASPLGMELGVYSFGDTQRNADGTLRATAEAIANLHEAIVLADAVGLDYFGVGEHHTVDMPASSPGAMVAAAAGATRQIRLGSSVTVLSTDDPVRVFQQFATADAISGGRVEITAGRGSSVESYPLFGYELSDHDQLYAEKLDLLMTLNSGERTSWFGSVRSGIDDLVVVPRPVHGSLPIWLGTGGSAPSTVRAGRLGLPVSYGIIGGIPARFGRLADLYRATAQQSGHHGPNIKVSAGTFGLIAPTKKDAVDRFYPGWRNLQLLMTQRRHWPEPERARYEEQTHAPFAYFVGDPDDVAERIIDLYRHLGHMRHFFQMDLGGLPHEHFLEAITLLGTEVKPRVQRLMDRL